jgi:hypothetical protein
VRGTLFNRKPGRHGAGENKKKKKEKGKNKEARRGRS